MLDIKRYSGGISRMTTYGSWSESSCKEVSKSVRDVSESEVLMSFCQFSFEGS